MLRRWVYLAPVAGLAVAFLAAGIDLAFFRGVTLQRLPDLGTQPPLVARVWISLLGSVFEEAFFRVIVATLVAWLSYMALSFFITRPKHQAEWVGTVAAAVLMGLWWHLDPAADLTNALRVLTVNVVVAMTYGWLYWSRGLEAAIMAHTVVYLCLFFVLPVLR